MLLKEELERIVLKHQEDLKKDLGTPRNVDFKLIKKFATIISGVRRGGKSTVARQFLKNEKTVYYIYFEDIHLTNFELKDFIQLEEIFKEKIGKQGTFFFDEIQNITAWENYVRQLVDRGEKVLITGSNASMLSRELGTKLTGRHLSYELFPFSYKEFLKIKKEKSGTKSFEKYLIEGGFPEYLKNNDINILRNLFQDIFYRDVLVRNDLKNESAIKSLLHYLLSNIGKEVSYNKLKELIGVGSGNSISQFINHFEEAYLLFSIKKHDFSVKKQIANPKKIYCIDNAIISTNAYSFSENKGRMLENAVFLELKRKNKEIFYFKNKHECDFLVQEGMRITQAIQVTLKLDYYTKEREIQGLLEAMKEHQLKEGLIITEDQEEEIIIENKKIIIKPAWKWLLE